MKQNVVNVVSMAANISDIFDKATPDKKNQLLRLLITDCKLNGKRLEYRLKAPFDKLITCTDSQKLSQITMDNLDEFEKVAARYPYACEIEGERQLIAAVQVQYQASNEQVESASEGSFS